MRSEKLGCIILAALFILGRGQGIKKMELSDFLPQEIGKWKASGQDQVFSRANIFDYLDGGGEVYLAYGFRKLLEREFLKPGEGPIVAEIYDMGRAEDAYGIFTHDSDGEKTTIGQGGLYGAGLLRFWKKEYFVRIMAEKETDDSKEAVMALGSEIDGAIHGEGEKPRLIACLPGEGLIEASVRYFHTQVSLNNHLFLGDANILDLNRETDAAVARYLDRGHKPRLLIVRYKDESRAGAAFRKFSREAPAADRTEAAGRSAERTGVFIVAVFEASDKKNATNLLNKAISRITEVFGGK